MSNGFKYHAVPKKQYLETFVNNWFAEQLERKFGRLPITIQPEDIGEFMEIVSSMHKDNQENVRPLVDILGSGQSVFIERDGA